MATVEDFHLYRTDIAFEHLAEIMKAHEIYKHARTTFFFYQLTDQDIFITVKDPYCTKEKTFRADINNFIYYTTGTDLKSCENVLTKLLDYLFVPEDTCARLPFFIKEIGREA